MWERLERVLLLAKNAKIMSHNFIYKSCKLTKLIERMQESGIYGNASNAFGGSISVFSLENLVQSSSTLKTKFPSLSNCFFWRLVRVLHCTVSTLTGKLLVVNRTFTEKLKNLELLLRLQHGPYAYFFLLRKEGFKYVLLTSTYFNFSYRNCSITN